MTAPGSMLNRCCPSAGTAVSSRPHRCGALPQHPLVDLERQAAAPPAGVKPHLAAAPAPLAPPPPPFAGEQGLVEAALVCLSTGSSGERQHAFAQQLIKQLAALADVGLGEPGSTAAHAAGGYASGIHSGTAASPAVVQVSAWLRLALLLPLLPLVYKHRSADAGGGLRGQLLRALLRLLASPAVCADAAAAAADCAGTVSGRAAATAAAAAAAAGEPLPQRLLHLLRALLVGGWASWMRLEGGPAGVAASAACRQHVRRMCSRPCASTPSAASPALPCRRQAARRPRLRAQPPAGRRGVCTAAAATPAGGHRGDAAACPAAGSGGGSNLPGCRSECCSCWSGRLHAGWGAGAAQQRRQHRGCIRCRPPQPRPLAAPGGWHCRRQRRCRCQHRRWPELGHRRRSQWCGAAAVAGRGGEAEAARPCLHAHARPRLRSSADD